MQLATKLRRKSPEGALSADDADKADAAEADSSKPSLRARLHAWWEGYDVSATAPEAENDDERPSAKAAGKPAAKPPAKEYWPRERIEVAQILWGKEFITPIGAGATTSLAQPLALAKGMAVLHLGCGLGGGTRALAQASSVTVTGMDESAALAKVGMDLSMRSKLKIQAPIAVCDLATFEFKSGAFDRALIEDIVHRRDDKEAALKRILRGLKIDAELLILDYMFLGKAAGPSISAWAAVDPSPVRPWNLDQARKTLAKLHVDVRGVEDETARCRSLIVGGLDAFLKGATSKALNRALTATLKREIDLWALRKAAFDAGELKAFALYGVKRGEAG